MATKKIILTGCKRYNQKGELFLEKEVYDLPTERADYLLKQFDPTTGYAFFEQYHGDAVGRLTGNIEADDLKHKESLGPKPRPNERRPRTERPGRMPRQATADQARPGSQSAPIETEDGVAV